MKTHPEKITRPKSASLVALLAMLASLTLSPSAEAARGRPRLNAAKTTFVADNGNLLRGGLCSTEGGNAPALSEFQANKTVGLNAVHVYAEKPGQGYNAGARVAALDLVVQRTRDEGMYLIITIGGGGVNPTFVNAFWNFYAGRYANETHVIYEITNEPVIAPGVAANVITMEQDAYNIIRSKAPNTPVLFFSYSVFKNGASVIQDINALGSGVNWNNAAIAFHGYGEGGRNAVRAAMQHVIGAGYPCFQTEFYYWPWGMGVASIFDGTSMYQDVSQTGDCERLGVSWLSFITMGLITNDARFKTLVNNGGITWTPDYGTWPSAPRSVYGNGGEPRATTNLTGTLRIQAEDFDNGGQGVSYSDTETANFGTAYRTNYGVDIQTTTDTDGGHNVGWGQANEWLEYTTHINDPGFYTLKVRVASTAATSSLRVRFGGVDVTGTWTFAATGGYQTWQTISKTVSLAPGQQLMRLELLSGFNVNWIELTPVTSGPIPNGTYKITNRNSGKTLDVVGAATTNGTKVDQWTYTGGSHQKWNLTHVGASQYKVNSVQTGKGLDVIEYSRVNGDHLQMYNAASTVNQRWIVTSLGGGYYKIASAMGGLALDITGASTTDGARAVQWQYSGANNQQWLIQAP